MAFRQPTVAPPRNIQPAPPTISQTTSPISQEPLRESQEWVVFTPSQAESSTTDNTRTTLGRTSRTEGLSRLSDFGSLRTNVRSGNSDGAFPPQEEDGELDSLDDGLHAFREPSMYRASTNRTDQGDGAVLPAHDGLGSFQASSLPVQEQLWQYEQHNPKRKFEGHHRRRSSVQRRLDTIDEVEARNLDEDKRMRIETWRLDQSRALLDEIERETRRQDRRQDFLDSQIDNTTKSEPLLDAGSTSPTTGDDPRTSENDSGESFWRRLTRRFIRDFIGIDESLLPVIFGESLPEDVLDQPSGSTQMPGLINASLTSLDSSALGATWRDRLLHRIARELGILVEQLTTHPGAFSAYLRSSDVNAEYAGMPTTNIPPEPPATQILEPDKPSDSSETLSNDVPKFIPTLNQQPLSIDPINAASWGLDDEPNSPISPPLNRHQTSSSIPTSDTEKAREYWERDLDFKMVFGYFKDRFSSRRHTSTSSVSQDPNRRAAIIRQYHPLVARNHAASSNRVSSSRIASQHIFHGLRRPGSSCASQSLRSSQKDRGSLARSGRGSSRNYWDIGGSVGSESGVVSTGGGMGVWGEV